MLIYETFRTYCKKQLFNSRPEKQYSKGLYDCCTDIFRSRL